MLLVFNPSFLEFICGPIAHSCGVRAIDSSTVYSTFDWGHLAKKSVNTAKKNALIIKLVKTLSLRVIC